MSKRNVIRISHRIPISHVDEIDEEVSCCLQAAYDLDAKSQPRVVAD